MSEPTPFPLVWPAGWARTERPRPASFKVTSFSRVRDGVLRNVEMIGAVAGVAADIVLSSNVPLGSHGLPLSGAPEPRDPGVAVYWTELRPGRPPRPREIACDRWRKVLHNLHAIELTLESMRGISRWGSTAISERAFAGFAALPPAATGDWRATFPGCHTMDEVRLAYRKLAAELHPDVNEGRGVAAMQAVTEAYNAAKAELLAAPAVLGAAP